MKTANAVQLALTKYQNRLQEVNRQIENCKVYLADARTWAVGGKFMDAQEFFVAQVNSVMDLKEQIAELEKEIPELEFKIRFTKWVLEDNQKDNDNE